MQRRMIRPDVSAVPLLLAAWLMLCMPLLHIRFHLFHGRGPGAISVVRGTGTWCSAPITACCPQPLPARRYHLEDLCPVCAGSFIADAPVPPEKPLVALRRGEFPLPAPETFPRQLCRHRRIRAPPSSRA